MKAALSVPVRILVALILAASALPLAAQSRQPYFDRQSAVILPDGYDPAFAYPVIVSLPWTGGTAEEFFQYYYRNFAGVDAILMFPPGRPERNHYLPDFLSFVGWYDRRVLDDLENLIARYSVNVGAIYLMGYSLGGDLGWALINRNPRLFRGAAMFGTRSSYPVNGEYLAELARRGARGYFGIGDREIPARADGIRAAYRRFRDAGIAVDLVEYPGAHVNPPANLVGSALSFLRLPGPVPVTGPAAQPGGAAEIPTPEAPAAGGAPPVASDSSRTLAAPAPPAETYSQWISDAEDWFNDPFDFDAGDDWDSWDFDSWDFEDSDFFDEPDGFFD
jgi:pimeloyl-ACP methyl ester carboxylesterase